MNPCSTDPARDSLQRLRGRRARAGGGQGDDHAAEHAEQDEHRGPRGEIAVYCSHEESDRPCSSLGGGVVINDACNRLSTRARRVIDVLTVCFSKCSCALNSYWSFQTRKRQTSVSDISACIPRREKRPPPGLDASDRPPRLRGALRLLLRAHRHGLEKPSPRDTAQKMMMPGGRKNGYVVRLF